jgi:lysophospholipase L1-like esterase
VALGDSSGYGAADCGGCVPYPVGLAARISADTGVAVVLHNLTQHNLLTSSMLLQELYENATVGTDPSLPRDPGEMASDASSPERIRDALAAADIITIQVGGNDIFDTLGGAPPYGCGGVFDTACVQSTIGPIEKNLGVILAQIAKLRAGRPTMIRIIGGDDGWVDDVGVAPSVNAQRAAGTLAMVVEENAADCRVAAANKAQCVDMFHVFNGASGTLPEDSSYFDPAGGHPNQKGQDAYVGAIAKLGYAPLQ